MKLEDMATLECPPGTVLVLRPKTHLTGEQLQNMHSTATKISERAGIKMVVIPFDMDVYAIAVEPAPHTTDVTHLVELDDDAQTELWTAYNNGSIVQWREHDREEWIEAHRATNPIPLGWGRELVELRKPPKK